METIDLLKAKDLAIGTARLVEPTLLKNFGRVAFETKSKPSDFVTEMDRWAERQIAEVLSEFDDSIAIVGEEYGRSGDSENYWTIDPIDGTSGYVRGIDYCTTMISLVIDNQPVIGVINDFLRGEMFWAIQGQGAFVNEDPLSVSSRCMDQAQLEFYLTNDRLSERIESLARREGARLRGTGGTGRTLSLVAAGRNEGFLSFNSRDPKIYDYAPGLVIASEAGAKIGSFSEDGRMYDGFSAGNLNVVVSNPETHNEIGNIVEKAVMLEVAA